MLLTVAAIPLNHTTPKKRARARLTRKSKASLTSPITPPIFGSRNESDFVDGDLRNFTQSISLRGIDLVQSYISSCLRNAAGHRGNAKLAVALRL
jgi:hypothetical protein